MGCCMRARNYCWVFLFLIYSGASLAVDYVWESNYDSSRYSTPSEGCNVTYPLFSHGELISLVKNSIYQYDCTYRYWGGGGTEANPNWQTKTTRFQRIGDACPAGTTYNAATGVCDPPENPCEALAGTSRPFTKSGNAPDGYMFISGGWSAPTQSGCFDGCLASTADQKCTVRTLLAGGAYLCRGTAWFTGAQCGADGAGGPDLEPSETPDYPDPEIITKTDPCIYTTQADGTQTCTSIDTEDREGQNCGTVNGKPICVDKPPTRDEVNIDTSVKPQTNADGSTTTTKIDTATSTRCTAIDKCTTTVTTVKTTTTADGAGNTTGSTTSCSGPSCADDNTNPDGNGDGLGDCVGGECGEGEGGGGDWYTPGEDTYQSVIEAFVDRVAAAPVLSGVSNFLAFNPSGSCPTYNVDVWVFHVRLDQWCTVSMPWDLIKAVILGCCAFMAFRIAFL